jgi:hypothetical protein
MQPKAESQHRGSAFLAIIAWAWRAGFAVEAQREFLKLKGAGLLVFLGPQAVCPSVIVSKPYLPMTGRHIRYLRVQACGVILVD